MADRSLSRLSAMSSASAATGSVLRSAAASRLGLNRDSALAQRGRAAQEERLAAKFGSLGSHESQVMKSYPMGMALPPLPSMAPVGPGMGFYDRLDQLAAEQRAGQERKMPIYSSLQSKSFKPPPSPVESDLAPDRSYKRSCQFTYTFQEPGGAFRMFSDTGLGSLQMQAERKATAEEAKAKKIEERQARMQAMIDAKEEKLRRRREVRASRHRDAAQRDAAASKIQAVHRGRRVRRKVAVYKAKRRAYAAERIQYSYRLHLDRLDARAELERRRTAKRENDAAARIQRAGVGKMNRKRAYARVEERKREIDRERKEMQDAEDNEAAARIQALYRGQKGREAAQLQQKKARRDNVARKQERRLQDRVKGELDRAGAGDTPSGRRSVRRGEGIGGPFGLSGGAEASGAPTPGRISRGSRR